MIRQTINVNDYWKIIVYYDVDYNLFDYVDDDLSDINVPITTANRIYYMLKSHHAKACTISSNKYKTSIICFNKHKTKADYIDSIVHEAEHVKQAMLKYYNIEDKGEPPAYTMGFLVEKLLKVKILKIS